MWSRVLMDNICCVSHGFMCKICFEIFCVWLGVATTQEEISIFKDENLWKSKPILMTICWRFMPLLNSLKLRPTNSFDICIDICVEGWYIYCLECGLICGDWYISYIYILHILSMNCGVAMKNASNIHLCVNIARVAHSYCRRFMFECI